MSPAFATPTLPLSKSPPHILHPLHTPRPQPQPTPLPTRMAIVSRPVRNNTPVNLDHVAPQAQATTQTQTSDSIVPDIAEVAAISAAVCDFMNTERLKDLANYIVTFGNKFDDLSQLANVRMTAVDAVGFTADIVSCDESQCVCVQERLEWPLGLCHNANDVINALKYLSAACGLPADF